MSTPRGGEGTPYNGLYGEAPPERGNFYRLQVYKRVGISRAEVYGGGEQGGGRPGEKGAGGVQEVGEEGAGSGIPKVVGSGRKREKLRNIAQYFAIEKMQRGGNQKKQSGNRDKRIREAGGLNPPVPPPPPLYERVGKSVI